MIPLLVSDKSAAFHSNRFFQSVWRYKATSVISKQEGQCLSAKGCLL